MKVNTDGVLLGAWTSVSAECADVLDVGTGTGTIGLMIAQRRSEMPGEWQVRGIDIDEASAHEAGSNFASSPWAGSLSSQNVALQDLPPGLSWDLIVSNPPYFDNSLQAPEVRRNISRHTDVGRSLSYRELASYASTSLSGQGRMSLILPADQEVALLRCLKSFSLMPVRICRIKSTVKKPYVRIMVESVRSDTPLPCEETTLTIHSGSGYSPEYLNLTRDFYLFA